MITKSGTNDINVFRQQGDSAPMAHVHNRKYGVQVSITAVGLKHGLDSLRDEQGRTFKMVGSDGQEAVRLIHQHHTS